MIVIGDLHYKSKEPYRKNILKFLSFLKESFNEESFIWTGDIVDSTKDSFHAYSELKKELESFGSHHYILMGNHDYKDSHGSPLYLFNSENITVIDDPTFFNLEGIAYWFIPYLSEGKMNISFKRDIPCDYLITHNTPEWESYGKWFFNPSGLTVNSAIIWGHIHIPSKKEQGDLINQVIGVPVTSRNGEQFFQKRIMNIKSANEYSTIPIHNYMNILTIEYGEDVPDSDKDSLIIIENAPSSSLAEEKYKDYYILKINQRTFDIETDKQTNIEEHLETNLYQQAIEFQKEKQYKKEEFDYFIKNIVGA